MNVTHNFSMEEAFYKEFSTILPSHLYFFVIANINCMASIATLNVLFKNSMFKSQTFFLIKIFFIHDLISSMYSTSWGVVVICMDILRSPIFFKKLSCFLVTGWQFFFIRNNSIFTFIISIDRLISTIYPQISPPEKITFPYLCLIFFGLSFSIVLQVFNILFDKFDDVLLVYCSARNSFGSLTIPLLFINTLFGGATCIVYITLFIFARFKINHVGQMPNQSTNIPLSCKNPTCIVN